MKRSLCNDLELGLGEYVESVLFLLSGDRITLSASEECLVEATSMVVSFDRLCRSGIQTTELVELLKTNNQTK